jgi:hypothetical protein
MPQREGRHRAAGGRGFTLQLTVEGDVLRSAETGEQFGPWEVTIRQVARYEGSPTDDMSIVDAIESRDGARGTLVDAFGVYSNPAVTAFVEGISTEQRPGTPAIDVGTRPGPPSPRAG